MSLQSCLLSVAITFKWLARPLGEGWRPEVGPEGVSWKISFMLLERQKLSLYSQLRRDQKGYQEDK